MLAIALVIATFADRSAALVLGGLYAVGAAGSRVHLADHNPPDVIGGMLCAGAAAFAAARCAQGKRAGVGPDRAW